MSAETRGAHLHSIAWKAAAVVWALVIFALSTGAFGPGFTAPLLAGALSLVHLAVSTPHFEVLNLCVRKAAHLAEYAIFAYLLGESSKDPPFPWRQRRLLACFLILVAYSLTDEYHQSFMPGRTASLTDCGHRFRRWSRGDAGLLRPQPSASDNLSHPVRGGMRASDKIAVTSGWRRAVMLPGQSWRVLSHPQPGQQEDSLRMVDIGPLTTMGAVLAYAVFKWGGVLRSDQYHYLLVLGLLAVVLSLARPRGQWAPLPDRAVRWTLALLPAYILMQVVPLPVSLVRVLSPARAEALAALDRIGARVNFASLSVSPAATFQSFLLVCGYVIVFLLVARTDLAI